MVLSSMAVKKDKESQIQLTVDVMLRCSSHTFDERIAWFSVCSALKGASFATQYTNMKRPLLQAPPSLKSTIMSLWLLTVFLGNALDAVITKVNFLSGAAFFFFFAGLMVAVAMLFVWTARGYVPRDYSGWEAQTSPHDTSARKQPEEAFPLTSPTPRQTSGHS